MILMYYNIISSIIDDHNSIGRTLTSLKKKNVIPKYLTGRLMLIHRNKTKRGWYT